MRKYLFLAYLFFCLPASAWAQKPKKEALLIPYRVQNQWGYSDEKGNIQIPALFEEADFFLQDLAKVRQNGLQGLIDKKGEIFLPCDYHVVYGAGKATRMVVCKGKKWGFVERYFPEKTTISLDYDLIRECGGKGLLGVTKQGRWGAINGAGKEIIPMEYEVANAKDHSFTLENQLIATLPTEEANESPYLKLRFVQGLARVGKDKKWGFLNEAGNAVIPISYPFVGEFAEDLVAVVQETPTGLRLGFVNKFNEMMIPCAYQVLESAYRQTQFKEGLALVCQEGKLGYITPKNTIAVPFRYAQAYPFSEGMAWASYDYHTLQPTWEMIDKEGNTRYKLPSTYQLLDYTFQQGFVRVREAGKENFLNRKGELLLKTWATHIEPFEDDLALVATEENGQTRLGYINSKGDWAIPPLYDYRHAQRIGNFIKLRLAGKFGIMHTKGDIVIPFEYDDIALPFYLPENKLYGKENRLPAQIAGKWGYLNQKNEWAISPEYEQARFFSEGYTKVKHEGKWGYLNAKGERFWR